MPLLRLVYVPLLLALASCASVEPPPVGVLRPVAVFEHADAVDRPFDLVGRLACSGSRIESYDAILDEIRLRACGLGADAVVVRRVTRSAASEGGRWVVDADAIRWRME